MSPMQRKDSKMDWVLPWDTSNLAGCWVFPFQAAPILLLPEATSGPIPRPQGRWWLRGPSGNELLCAALAQHLGTVCWPCLGVSAAGGTCSPWLCAQLPAERLGSGADLTVGFSWILPVCMGALGWQIIGFLS